MRKPARHVIELRPDCIFRVHQLSHLVGLVQSPVKPWPEQQLLFPTRAVAAFFLTPEITLHRTLHHEVIPTPNRKAGHIHFPKVQLTVLLRPVAIVVWMLVPILQQRQIVRRISAARTQALKPLGSCHSTDPITFVKETQTRIHHVLADQMRRLRHGQEVLGKTTLRTAKGSHLSGAPRLRGQPLTHVETILQFPPSKRSIPNPRSFALVSPTVVHHRHGKTTSGQIRRRFSRTYPCDVRIPLLEHHGHLTLFLWLVEIGRKPLPITHRDHDMLLGHITEIDLGQCRVDR